MLEKLSISYDSFKVTQLYMIECKIENTGNKELTPDDFLDEIIIDVDRIGKILTVNLDLYPANMSSDFGYKLYYMRLKPDMLNPNDYIIATLFYSCDTSDFNPPIINSRIKNGEIKTINKSQNGKGFKFYLPFGKTTETILFWVTLIMNLFYVLIILYASFKYNQDKPFYVNIIVFLILSFSIMFSILYMIKDM
ncbi:MAG: hypothetical protein HOP30_17265 [Cyclobacteriaceae bacterium]|nr:hypothetical protein [Cyclobacteriaceae bacterium]